MPPAPTEEDWERARQAAGFHAALEYLASEGVEPDKAGRKLAALLSAPSPLPPLSDAFSPGGAAVNSQGRSPWDAEDMNSLF